MTHPTALLQNIQSAPTGLMLAELLAQHPTLARRTVQRWRRSFGRTHCNGGRSLTLWRPGSRLGKGQIVEN